MARTVVAATVACLHSGCAFFGGSDDKGSPEKLPEEPKVAVEVTGVESELEENVRLFLSLASETCDAAEWRVERLYARVNEEASGAVRAFGYYAAAVESELDRVDECWRLRVAIEPGEPVLVEAVELKLDGEAGSDPEFAALVLPIKSGDVLNHAKYESAKSRIASLAAQRGYFEGRFTRSEFRVDVEARSAVVSLAYDSGPRYTFGPFEVTQDAFDTRLIERLYESPTGRPYDATELAALSRRLNSVGYFSEVIVRPEVDAAQGRAVPVTLKLTPRRKHSFSVGAGISTDEEGPRARVGYENRRVNRRGHRWSARANASAIRQDVQVEYGIPRGDPSREWLTFRAGYAFESADNVENRSSRIGVRETKKRRWNWLETRYLDVTEDDFEVGRDKARTTLVVPGLAWTRTEVDDRLDPGRGWRATLDARGAIEKVVLSDASLFRVHINGDWLHRFAWKGRVLTRGEAGALFTPDFDEMPPSQRFFAGGDLSVRGYGYRELGPVDASGEAIGARYVLTGSLEYEHPVKGAFSGAAFVDAGNVADDPNFRDGFGVGVGLGVRWRSPVGPVRFDLAHPLNKSDDVVTVHFRLGPDL